jgi:hypothetical protein
MRALYQVKKDTTMSRDSISPGSDAGFDHETEFERAWADPRYTRTKTVSFDVNEQIERYFRTSKPLTFTRTMMWDNEVRKGWRPDIYIPSVIRPGSVRSWGGARSADGWETFARASMIRQWLSPEDYGCVVERIRAYHDRQKIVFIGTSELRDDNGTPVHADTKQPLYYFEHWVEGTENQPVANWRTVHLTEEPNQLIPEIMELVIKSWVTPGFPEFIPIYISHDLKIELEPR